MAHVVDHVTRDSGGPCSNPGVGNHYFSHAVTFGVLTHLCKLELTSLQGRRSFKGWGRRQSDQFKYQHEHKIAQLVEHRLEIQGRVQDRSCYVWLLSSYAVEW